MTSGPPSILPPSDNTRDESEPPTERQHYAPTFRGTSVIDTSGARPFADAPTSRHADVNTTLDPGNSTAQFGGDADLPPPTYPTIGVQFHSNTIAPSPPLTQSPTNASTPRFEPPAGEQSAHQPSPLGAGVSLRIATDGIQVLPVSRTDSLGSSGNLTATRTPQRKTSQAALQPVSRTPSLKTALGYGFGTASAASSTVSSPIISALGDVTPLPSPLLMSDSPGPWRKLVRPPSRDAPTHLSPTPESCLVTSNGESVASALANNSKRKAYAGLAAGAKEGEAHGGAVEGPPTHARNRSISDYVPDGNNQIPKRMLTVSGPHGKPTITTEQLDGSFEGHMRREPHLSEARGLTPVEKPPTPPPSESSSSYSDAASAEGSKRQHEYFEARGREDNKMRRWRAIKLLGQGTFSRVMLATSLAAADAEAAAQSSGLLTPEPLSRYDRRSLVAVKVCEHGPKGGASEDRVEMSLKRELEIMQSIRHPSLVHLKAWNIELTRAILVLSYCPGGDLFDVASSHRELLTPPLLRRIFTELVGAVSYLHERRIVHRDIKLENVLVNLPPKELADASIDWATYPYSVATLTDLGLSRRVADDEKLETRCGSDDYAAPEVIMGQPYDGRAIDAWSMGVLLYALLEGRLPFDPHPGMSDAHRMRSRTSHRIARVEWRWLEYAGEDGDHEGDTEKFQKQGLLGAMQITEGLLKRARSRWTVEKLLCHEWIKEGIRLEGGVQFREEQEAEEVS